MSKIERLSQLAAQRADPKPLDVSGVMAGIRGLEIEEETFDLPLGFLTGGTAVAAAAAAVIVTLFGLTAWNELATPIPSVESLLDVMDFML